VYIYMYEAEWDKSGLDDVIGACEFMIFIWLNT